nr:hypothetical protein HK105_002219 [Polyrhizophydium stewartii]
MCQYWADKYAIQPYRSWGSMPESLKASWDHPSMQCNTPKDSNKDVTKTDVHLDDCIRLSQAYEIVPWVTWGTASSGVKALWNLYACGVDFCDYWRKTFGYALAASLDAVPEIVAQPRLAALATAAAVLLPLASSAGVQYTGVSQTGLESAAPQLPSAATIAHLTAMGANVFRFPVLWENFQSTPNGTLNSNYMAKLDAAIGYVTAASAASVSIIDLHNNGTWAGVALGSQAATADAGAFADLWGKIAARYAGYPTTVWFGLMNAPNLRLGTCAETTLWYTYVSKAVAAIRATGANNMILVPAALNSTAETWQSPCTNGDTMHAIVDSSFAYDVQQYFVADGTPTAGTCTKTVDVFTSITAWLKAKNQKAFLSSFAVNWDDVTCQSLLPQYLAYFDANSQQWLGWAYWAGGPNMPIGGFYYVESQSDSTDSSLLKLLASYFVNRTTTSSSGGTSSTTIIVVAVVVVGALLLGAVTVLIVVKARRERKPGLPRAEDEDASFKPVKKRANTDRKSMMEERELRDAVKQMMLSNNVPVKDKPETRPNNALTGKQRMRLDAASATETFQAKNVNLKDTDSSQFSHFVNFTSSRFQVESQAPNNDDSYLF